METGSSLTKPMHQLLNCRVEQCLYGSAIVTKEGIFIISHLKERPYQKLFSHSRFSWNYKDVSKQANVVWIVGL